MSMNLEGALGKRRRSDSTSQDIRDRISAQLELEVDLRLRSIEAAEAKLQWAQAMQNALVENMSRGGGAEDDSSDAAFRDEAQQVLDAINLLDPVRRSTGTNAPIQRERSRSPLPYGAPLRDSASPNDNEMMNEPSFSPSADTEVIMHHTKPLFIQRPISSDDSGQSPLDVVLISCETCHRSDFTSLHSLLSHARMSHSIFYKSHEELIDRCGRVFSSESAEAEYIRRHGKEVSANVRVGMRSVIEEGVKYEEESGSGLGLHSESAGVGEILRGKETRRRREIRVFEPDEEVNIIGGSEDETFPPSRFLPRSTNSQKPTPDKGGEWEAFLGEIDIFAEVELGDARDAQLESVSASRFHAKRRVVITDSSHYMLVDQRIDVSRPYQWMISLSAPSYSENISTFASKLTVTPAKAPTEFYTPESIVELTATEPPFAVVGLASEPFMARIRIDWVGGGISKPLEVEHWVRMDASKVNRTRMGDTQMIDIELDRDTPFLAEPESTMSVRLPLLALLRPSAPELGQTGPVETSSAAGLSEKDAMQIDSPEHKPKLEFEGPSDGSEAIKLLEPALRRWAAKLPLTSQDLRARTRDGRLVNYPLPRSAKEFTQLEMGRRKAYEWRHAMSLRAALQKNVNSDETLALYPEHVKSLTTGTVYRWLDEHQPPVFPRPPAPDPASFYASSSNADTVDYHQSFCRYCGLSLARHPMELDVPGVPMDERIEGVVYDEPGWRPILCGEAERLDGVARPPSIDTSSYLTQVKEGFGLSRPLPSMTEATALAPQFENDLLRWTDPALVRWMDNVVSKWSLSSFTTLRQPALVVHPPSSIEDVAALARKRIDAARESTVPLALLAQVTRVLVKDLVARGVDAARRMAEDVEARRQIQNGANRVQEVKGGDGDVRMQVLTSSHILLGLEGAERKTRLLKLAVGRLTRHDPVVKSEPEHGA